MVELDVVIKEFVAESGFDDVHCSFCLLLVAAENLEQSEGGGMSRFFAWRGGRLEFLPQLRKYRQPGGSLRFFAEHRNFLFSEKQPGVLAGCHFLKTRQLCGERCCRDLAAVGRLASARRPAAAGSGRAEHERAAHEQPQIPKTAHDTLPMLNENARS